ncbi:MAG: hypothetical protein ACLFNT_01995 [Spirochaetales bacterium]
MANKHDPTQAENQVQQHPNKRSGCTDREDPAADRASCRHRRDLERRPRLGDSAFQARGAQFADKRQLKVSEMVVN